MMLKMTAGHLVPSGFVRCFLPRKIAFRRLTWSIDFAAAPPERNVRHVTFPQHTSYDFSCGWRGLCEKRANREAWCGRLRLMRERNRHDITESAETQKITVQNHCFHDILYLWASYEQTTRTKTDSNCTEWLLWIDSVQHHDSTETKSSST